MRIHLSRSGRSRHRAIASRGLTFAVSAAALLASALAFSGPAAARTTTAHDYQRACAAAHGAGRMACLVLIRTNVAAHAGVSANTPAGYGPSDLWSAYGLAYAASHRGGNKTVAIVDAYNYPTAASDLAVYRATYGLPACGAGCFTQYNENGQTSPLPPNAGTSGWDVEEALDIDMVSAICPKCHIDLMEANAPTIQDLGTAVNSAVALGAKYVSNSYGGGEDPSDTTYDSAYFNHPGVAITASAGDSGFGAQYPAASQYVTSVGGTSLVHAGGSRGWSETVWGTASGGEGTGSGCSAYDPKPSWQTDTAPGDCTMRTIGDVAAVADPNTGVAIYNTYSQSGWLVVGGTSVSAPVIASVYAVSQKGNPASGSYPASFPYHHLKSLNDVVAGANGTCTPVYLCTGEAGYDGPTGNGTPHGAYSFHG